jgi:hypothetical protein
MEIKEKARDRMELRIYAKETLDALLDFINTVKPSNYLPASKEGFITDEQLKTTWRDYTDESGKIIKKVWKIAHFMADDVIAFMDENCAKFKDSSESK